MFAVMLDFLASFGETILKLAPYIAVMGVLFAALSWFSPCNASKPWWKKRGLLTDVTYLFVSPVLMRYFRIGLAIMIAMYLVGITTQEGLVGYFDHGHGPVSRLPFWLQLVLYVGLSEFALYWIHRANQTNKQKKNHAVHH